MIRSIHDFLDRWKGETEATLKTIQPDLKKIFLLKRGSESIPFFILDLKFEACQEF